MGTQAESKLCFVGSARYREPLGVTEEKKFRLLKTLGELFIIGFAYDGKPHRFIQDAHFYLLPGLPWPVLRYLTFFLVAPFLILWLHIKYDMRVFIAQSPYEGLPAVLIKILMGWAGRKIAVVVENHGDFEESLFMQRRVSAAAAYRAAMRHVARYTIRRVDVFRAVSDSTREQLERWKPGCRVVQFVAWTDIEAFQQVGKQRTETCSQTFAYAGVIIPRKGLIHLINAFITLAEDFPDAQLLIVGSEDNPDYAEQLKVCVREAGLESRVIFPGGMSQQQLAEYLGQADVFVFPSYSEGLPRAVYEAMAAALPVIATAVSGIPQVVREGETGFLLEPGDEAGFAEKMRWTLEHPEETREMGRKAFSFANAFFSGDSYRQGYREILDAVRNPLPK